MLATLSTLPPLHAQVSLSASSKPLGKARPASKAGALQDGNYRNSFFGFSYKLPYGWVDRTSDMSAGAEAEKSMVLLSAFERPPEAKGEDVNSAVVIAAESLKDYRGIKTAADYLGPVSQLAEQRGFKTLNEPYEFTAGMRKLARADFSKERGRLTMWQSTLVMIEKGEIVSFTFVGGSDDEIDELIEQLKFGARMSGEGNPPQIKSKSF